MLPESPDHIHFCGPGHVAPESELCRKNPILLIKKGSLFFRKEWFTIDSITTQGKLSEETISRAKDVFPEPELPAIPIMLVSAHGGE